MQTARMELKLSQKEVAQKINEKPSVLQDYESGKAIPNAQILAKLERTLGVKLRGTSPWFQRPLFWLTVFISEPQVVTLGRSWRVRKSRNSFSP
jgi:transcriptional regulator with XRE-family HTH domain